jgi:hypothetical protein
VITEDNRYIKTDESFSLSQATAIALGMTPFIGLVVLGLFSLIWGMDSLLAGASLFKHLDILLPTIFIGILIHEGLHWLGYVGFAHLPWRTVRFGFSLRSFAAYVHSDSLVSISAYRCLVALPGVILGVIPVFVGIGWELASMTLYGFLMLVGASGDIAILWKIRHVLSESFVMDHPYRAGCWVFVEKTNENSQSSKNSEKRTQAS